MSRIESLETRRLLAALVPDVAWGDDGFVSRAQDQNLIGVAASGIYASTPASARVDNNALQGHIRRYDLSGKLSVDYGKFAEFFSADVDTNGRLYVSTSDRDQVTVRRFTASGKIDRTFATRGTLTLSLDDADINGNANFRGVTPSPDGGLYLAFSYTQTRYDKRGEVSSVKDLADVYKIDRRGRIDRRYADNGRKQTDHADWIAVTPDGRATFASIDNDASTVVRYLPSGKIDTGFADNGTLAFKETQISGGLAYDASGRLLIAEQVSAGTFEPATYRVRRLTAAGQPDPRFGIAGIYTAPITAESFNNNGTVLVLPDGRILAGFDDSVVRITDRGRTDTTFDNDGVAETGNLFSVIAALPDGSLLGNVDTPEFDRAKKTYAGVAKLTLDARPVVQGRSGVLYVNGYERADVIRIESGGRGRVNVNLDGDRFGPFAGIIGVRVDGLGGGDAYDGSFFTGRVPQTVFGGDGNDTIITGGGRDFVYADSGDDSVTSNAGNDTVVIDGGNSTADTGAGDDHVTGGPGNDRITAADGNDTIDGQGGNDTVTGGDGDDLLQLYGFDRLGGRSRADGGAGDDTILTGDNRDTVYAGSGNDRVGSYRNGSEDPEGEDGGNGDNASPYIPALTEVTGDVIDLGDGNDLVNAPAGNNLITGGDGDDTLRAGIGRDSLVGGNGRDSISGGDGDDDLQGGSGRDRLNAGLGDDRLSGGADDDVLIGGPGADTLFGEDGNDTLIAGPTVKGIAIATNRLDGGAGKDLFQVESSKDLLDRVEMEIAG